MIRCALKHGPMGYTLLFSRNGKSGVEADAEENEVSDSDSDLDSLSPFIGNQENGNELSFYRSFNNVENDINETLKKEYEDGLKDIENLDEISNLCESSEEELEIDDIKNSEEKIKN